MRYTIATAFALASVVGLLPFGAAAMVVNCNSPNASIQDAVDGANGPTTISIKGMCQQDVSLTKDDITLSGKLPNTECDKADPSASADATIDGTVTVDGVRAKIEFLEITGSGAGVTIINRADVRLFCNDISNNEESGVAVIRTSNAVLTDNTLSSNGQQGFDKPFVFSDVGLFVADASSVRSNGNTYEDNQYAAIEADRQGAFRNGSFLPREDGHAPIAGETDTIIQRGGDPGTPATCIDNDFGPLAIVAFNSGVIDLRNANVCGEVDVSINSSFRIDDAGGNVIGNVSDFQGSWVAIRDRGLDMGRGVTFTGTLQCGGFSGTFGNPAQTVRCGQTCSGAIQGTCFPKRCNDGIDNDGDGDIDFPADLQCADALDDDESS